MFSGHAVGLEGAARFSEKKLDAIAAGIMDHPALPKLIQAALNDGNPYGDQIDSEGMKKFPFCLSSTSPYLLEEGKLVKNPSVQ